MGLVGAYQNINIEVFSSSVLERDDFASGTSSRSTKLIHGGVRFEIIYYFRIREESHFGNRYLENAFMKGDIKSLGLVFDALRERGALIENAPHLTKKLPIITPCYKYCYLYLCS